MLMSMSTQLGTDCRLELKVDGENSVPCETVWRSSTDVDSGVLWVSFHC